MSQKCDLLPGLSVYQTLRYAANLTIGKKVLGRSEMAINIEVAMLVFSKAHFQIDAFIRLLLQIRMKSIIHIRSIQKL